MNTMVVYDKKTGEVISTNSPAESEYGVLVADIPDYRRPEKVVDGQLILEDTPEIKEAKQRLEEIEKEQLEIKMKLLDEVGGF